jgi:hypothetical protein
VLAPAAHEELLRSMKGSLRSQEELLRSMKFSLCSREKRLQRMKVDLRSHEWQQSCDYKYGRIRIASDSANLNNLKDYHSFMRAKRALHAA